VNKVMHKSRYRFFRVWLFALIVVLSVEGLAQAQNDDPKHSEKPQSSASKNSDGEKAENGKAKNGEPQSDDAASDDETATTIFSHPNESRFYVAGQANIIYQRHGVFRAPYNGDNSLRATREKATSDVLTLYTGFQINNRTELLVDIESAGGRGISDALGLAGYTNLDVVRNPTLGAKPYLARGMIRFIVPLSSEETESERTPISLATKLSARRLEIRAGKMSAVDFFDVNSVGSDSHLQFMNWTIDNNGAYDYAADTRGYTYGVLVEYQTKNYAARYGLMLMPKVANGINLDLNVARARGENFEFERRGSLLPFRQSKNGALRLLGYVNHANMGSYREAIDAYLAGRDKTPDVTAHRKQGRVKYGFGANFEQELTKDLRAFGRFGWNEGANESFAYTEVNQTIAFGGDLRGRRWKRKQDKFGAAFVINHISGDHRRYLALGGLGFLLGDGRLTYGREQIFETYYTAHVWRGLFLSFDLQRIVNPGYNRDRGPATVPGARLHVDF
jgi:high affinity Mn2+ porin